MATTIPLAEYEARMAAYSERLGERERIALWVAVPPIVLIAVLPFVFDAMRPNVPLTLIAVPLLTLLTLAASFIGIRAWRADRREGVIVPCPACRRELVTQFDEVMPSGNCPFCGQRAISEAT